MHVVAFQKMDLVNPNTSDSIKKSKNNWTWKGKRVTEKQLMDSMGVSFKKYNDSINKADNLKPAKHSSKADTTK